MALNAIYQEYYYHVIYKNIYIHCYWILPD